MDMNIYYEQSEELNLVPSTYSVQTSPINVWSTFSSEFRCVNSKSSVFQKIFGERITPNLKNSNIISLPNNVKEYQVWFHLFPKS